MPSDMKTALQDAKVPGKASPFLSPEGQPRYWNLYYRYGNIPQVVKAFRLDGTTKDAILRARKHCEIMGFKYILVRPMVVDLDFQEEQFIRNKGSEQNSGEMPMDL